jgi:hypothetical protein
LWCFLFEDEHWNKFSNLYRDPHVRVVLNLSLGVSICLAQLRVPRPKWFWAFFDEVLMHSKRRVSVVVMPCQVSLCNVRYLFCIPCDHFYTVQNFVNMIFVYYNKLATSSDLLLSFFRQSVLK